jgi:uncharacterized cupredoxin-like copper-binding protein
MLSRPTRRTTRPVRGSRRGLALATTTTAAAAALLAAGCSSAGTSAAGAPASTSATSAPAAVAPSSAATGAAGGATTVTATETEYHIALSQTTFSAGSYKFVAVDKGKLQHNLVINGPGVNDEKTPGLLAPGQSASVTVTLAKGTYDIFCGVPGHQALGMDVHITVP